MAHEKQFQCSVITPEREVLDAPATFVAFPAHDGEIGVLANRAPLVCKMGIGVLRMQANEGRRCLFVDGGFAQVLDNRLTILTQAALAPDEIDQAGAESALLTARKTHARTTEEQQARRHTIARASAQLRTLQS